MPRLILTFFVIALFTFLLGRLSGKFWYRRSAGRSGPAASGDELVQDPNCGTYVSKKNALAAATNGVTRYFCSRECAEGFEKKQEK